MFSPVYSLSDTHITTEGLHNRGSQKISVNVTLEKVTAILSEYFEKEVKLL